MLDIYPAFGLERSCVFENGWRDVKKRTVEKEVVRRQRFLFDKQR